jgi:hypothetical protein
MANHELLQKMQGALCFSRTGHSVQLTDPVTRVLNVPLWQVPHSERPLVAAKAPAPQARQVAWPATAEMVPATH